ncbi:hypothetical protein KM043_002963 [Ampulex compressa]|nr:hypothetical protein KM043_002963 [Ampulex compressa]
MLVEARGNYEERASVYLAGNIVAEKVAQVGLPGARFLAKGVLNSRSDGPPRPRESSRLVASAKKFLEDRFNKTETRSRHPSGGKAPHRETALLSPTNIPPERPEITRCNYRIPHSFIRRVCVG